MNLQLINLFNERVNAVLHNALKAPVFYFLLFFSVILILLFPFYVKNNGIKLAWSVAVSAMLSIVSYLLYIIYVTGGFNV